MRKMPVKHRGERKQGKAARFPGHDAGLTPGKGEGGGKRVRWEALEIAVHL